MRRRKNEMTVGEAVKEFIRWHGMEERVLQSMAEDAWQEEMGGFLKSYTERIYVKKRIMYVKLNSPALKEELSFGKSKIIAHLNEGIGEEFIQDLKFL
ncbi:Zn-ribbon-containing, possibly RNA-binding protein and truncated derivatives [Candidatus Ornithobacterium hominis]|uniref:Zn-ribbon-containing, possibly RNA-binding protein and truncated derivatives n=2 Tax=Candidatus Ornithobacterium hominis TaxID=2497989 RepID=A0A383TZ79_9FLAO|nr:Zn-ribbon-containing, possibly RNA-binding protein and truncated derivatives [Candidatus Ornithobacterium hominis]